MSKRPGVLLPLAVGIAALIGFGWLWIVLEPSMATPASTVVWLLSELVFALALAVPAVCLFFVIRAVHIRRVQAREAAGPRGVGVEKARDLLWSLSHGLLPQTESARDIPTDATEPVFLYAPLTYARQLRGGSSVRRMLVTGRSVTAEGGSGWGPAATAAVAATDRRLLLLLPDALFDIAYSDITAVNLDRGLVVLGVDTGTPVLLAGEAAESVAVLAVWGSVGESALRRHPALAGLRA